MLHLCFFFVIKSKCVHLWLYIKGRDLFVCICGFNGTNGTEALVCARAVVTDNSSNEHSVISKATHFRVGSPFNTNKQNEYSATQLKRFHLLQVCLYRETFQKLTFRWCMSRIYRGISDLTAYTAGTKAHIRFISDLFPHMNEAWNRSENIGIHVTFSCLHGRRPYPICVTCEDKIGIGSLEPCSVMRP